MANPFDQFDAPAASGGNPFDQFDEKPKVKEASAARKLGDLGLSVAKGVVAVPEAAVGLADLVSGGRAGKFLENEGGAIGFRPKQAKEFLTSLQSDDLQSKQQQFQQADGVVDKFGVAVTNPSLIANAVAESVPLMGAGAVPARALLAAAPGVGAVGAGAIGEGLVGAGSAAEQIRQETKDGLLTGKQALLAGGSGAATAAFGAAGGAAARRLGIADVDTALTQGTLNAGAAAANKGLVRRTAEGVLSEGVLEELPQSLSEQALQNIALDKPVTEGLADAGVMGVLAGGVMGGGAAALTRQQQAQGLPDPDAGQPPVQPAAPASEQPPAPFVNPASLTGNNAAALLGGQGAGLTGAADPLRAVVTPSQAMGIDPNAGAISRVAAEAVDGPASMEMAVRQAEAAIAAQDNPEAGADPLTAAPDPLISQVAGYVAEMGTASPQMIAAKFGVTTQRAAELLAQADPTVDDLFPPPQGAANVNNTDAAGALAAGVGGPVGVDAAGGQPDAGLLGLDGGRAGAGTAGAPAPSVQESVAAPVPGRDSDAALKKGPTQTKAKVGGLKELIARNKAAKANVQDQPQGTAPAAAPAPAEAVQAPQAVGSDGTAQPGAAPAGNPGVEAAGVEPQATKADLDKLTIPDMTDAQLQAAVSVYGPDSKRTTKVLKEIERRKAATTPAAAPATTEPTNGTQATQAVETTPQGREETALLSDSVKQPRTSAQRQADAVRVLKETGNSTDALMAMHGDGLDPDDDVIQVIKDAAKGFIPREKMKLNKFLKDNTRQGKGGTFISNPREFFDQLPAQFGQAGFLLRDAINAVGADQANPAGAALQSAMKSEGWTGEDGTPSNAIWIKRANGETYTARMTGASSMEVTVLVNGVGTQIGSTATTDPKAAAKAASKAMADDVADSAAPAPTQQAQAPAAEPSPLLKAMNDLADVRAKIAAQGQVVDDRLLQRERQLKAMVKELEADGQNDELDAEMRSYENKAAPLDMKGRNKGDMLTMANGTQYRVVGVDEAAGRIRLVRNPDMLSERNVSLGQEEYDRLVADHDRTRAEAMAQSPAPAPAPQPAAKDDALAEREKAAKAKMLNAAAKLANLLSKNTRANITPEQEQAMLPIAIELFEGAMELGYVKFKQAAKYVRQFIANAIDQDAADSLPVDTLQGAYIAVSRRHKDKAITPKAEVITVDSAEEIDAEPLDNAATQADTGAPKDGNAAQQLDSPSPSALDGTPSGDVLAPAESGDAGQGADRGGRSDSAGNPRPDDAGGDLGRGVGGNAGAVPVPAGRTRANAKDGKKPRVSRAGGAGQGLGDAGRPGGLTPESGANPAPNAPDIPAPQPSAEDFTITDELALGEGGQKTKFKNNVAAIRLMRDLEQTGRMATPDEQMVLAKYVGWGGLSQAFDPNNADWAKEHAEITALMSPDELAAAARSTRYAHYTSREIIVDGIYAAMRRFGFSGGKTLEAGAGVGNFIGLMPADMRSAGRFTAIEREPFSSAIARQLYPQQSVQRADFTEFKGTDAYFDAAVGNPPFASDPQTDRSGRKHLSGLSLHNYFFAKSIDMLREGGIMAQVVTNSFLDAKGDKARRYISDRVEFLGAIRLPNNAFSKNAGTEVTTDIIFLKKRPDSEVGGKAARADAKRWLDTGIYTDKRGRPVALNQYFIDNPEMMLGDFGAYGTMYGPDQPALVARQGQDTLAMLKAAVEKLPAGVYKSIAETGTAAQVNAAVVALKNPTVKEGGYFVEGGKLMQRLEDIAGEARAVEITADTPWTAKTNLGEAGVERIKALAEMRSTVRGLLAAEMADNSLQMTALRATLNKQYDNYREAHGLINDPSTLRVFDDDPDFPLLASLEHGYTPGIGLAAAKRMGVKPTKSTAKKGPIFTQRVVAARQTVQKVETPADALAVSMAERGKLDAAYIGQLLGMEPDAVLKALSTGDKPLLFRDPATDEYVLRDAYLSGNVRAKLAQAREAGMFTNVTELEAVQPEDVGSHEITARLGSPWVPVEVYQDFAKALYGEDSKVSVAYLPANSSFQVLVYGASDVAMANTWGTPEYPGDALLQAVMNNRTIKVTYRDSDGKTHTDVAATEKANEKAQQIKEKFNDWLFADADRSEVLTKAYNETNNNYVTRVYDGSNMTFPGKVPDSVIKFRRHQRNAIARIVQDRTALLDHVVGAGKTFTVISGAMELKRTGLARKPMVAVPNHLVKQWAADFYRLYPGANVLTATKKDFEKPNRRKFLAKIATGDWDAVVIAHSSFGFIKPAPEYEAEFNQREIRKIMATIKTVEDGDGDKQVKKRTVKQLEGMKERLENRIRALRDKPMDDLLDFEQIGVDQLFVDEAHLFKNLMFTTKMQGVSGLNDPTGSQRAYDMYVKTNQIMEKNGRGQGVVFATGTPVSNSLAEMYHMMRYLMPNQMKELGFESFDAWANTYASVEQVWMQAPSGDGFKAQNRMSNFVNTPELLKMFDQVSDTVTMDDIKKAYAEENDGAEFPLPKLKGGRRTPVSMDKSAAQDEYMADIAKRAKAIEQRKGPPQKGDDNILVVMGDARKAAMDIRLVKPDVVEREKGGRIDLSTDAVVERYKKFDSVKGTQLVFSDLGTPLKHAKKELAEYEALQARIQAGNEEVAISAALGNEAAMETMEDAEAAQAELDSMGADWLSAVKAALRGFSVYDDFRAALVEKGIPEAEIAFIHDYNTDDQKASLFRKVNAGQIRVLLGSTAKLGAGTNVQERLVALHHLDVPWRPSDVEQREGRIERQGNRLMTEWPDFEIEILAYVTKDTLDMRMWQVQETKLKMINQLRTRKIGREIDNAFEDMELSAGEMQAAATGDINLLKEIQLRNDVKKLEQRRRAFDGQRNDLLSRKRRNAENLRDLPGKLAQAQEEAAAVEQYRKQAANERPPFKMNIDGKDYTDADAAQAVLRALDEATDDVTDLAGQVTKKKRPLSVTIDGETIKNRALMTEMFSNARGDVEAIAWDFNGETYRRRTVIGNAIRAKVQDAIADESIQQVGTIGAYAVAVEGSTGKGGVPILEVTLSRDGEVKLSNTISANDSGSMPGRVIAQVENLMDSALREANYLERGLERAKKEAAELAKAEVTDAWPDQAKLDAAREAHKAVLAQLKKKEEGAAPDADVAFSRTPGKSTGITNQAAEQIVGVITSRWANAPEVVVVESVQDPKVPAAVRRADAAQRSQGATGEPEGFWYGGKAYIVSGALNRPVDVVRVLFHEVLGHYGLRGTFGADLKPILAQIATMRKSEVQAKATEYGLDMAIEADRLQAAEEVLAVMAQSNPQAGFVKRAIGAIRAWLRENIPGLENMRLTDNDIVTQFILPARRFVQQGPAARVGDGVLAMSRDEGVRFSRSPRELAGMATDQLKMTLTAPGKLSWWHKTVGTMYNLAERHPAFKPVFNAAQSFIDDVSYYATEAADLAPKMLPKLESWKDIAKSPISAEDNKAIEAPINEGTLLWARDESGRPVKVAELEAQAAELTADQKARRLLRNDKINEGVLRMWQGLPQEQYEKLIASRYESQMLTPGVVWTDAELKAIWKLNDAQIGLYREVRAAIDKSLDNLAKSDLVRFTGKDGAGIKDAIMEAGSVDEAALMARDYFIGLAEAEPDRAEMLLATANGIMDRADKVERLKEQGYAPLSRFGKYTVDVVTEEGRQYFGLFESMREANQMAARMRGEFGKDAVSQGTLSDESFKLFQGITPETLELFGNMLGLSDTGDTPQDQAFQAYLKLTKNNRSAMKRLIQRKGILGYSQDVGRVLANFIYSNARQTAGALHIGDLTEAVNAIPQSQGELKDEAVRLAEYIQNPQEEAQAFRGLLFAQYLGGSIASAMVNMTQPLQVSLPYLSQFGGVGAAGKELMRAIKGIATGKKDYEPDLARALKHAEEDGTVSPQEVHQLMAQARGAGTLRSGDGTKLGDALAKGGNAWAKMSLAWGKVFGVAEQMNRRSTFIAAYRLAKAQKMADPAGFAKKAVQETQFIYSKANKMRWGRGAIGGVAMTFKTYSIAYLELLNRMATQGGPEGKRAAMLAVAVLLVMGGAGGLPFMEDAEDITDAIAQVMGYNFSTKQAKQELLQDLFGEAAGQFIERGVSGLPGVPLDVTGRLGMGNLIPGTGMFLQKNSNTRDVLEIAGPAGDLAQRVMNAGGMAVRGNLAGAALELSPKALRDLAKGADMANTGMYRDAKGFKVIDTTAGEAGLKAIGFQPNTVAQVQESNYLMQRQKDYYNATAQSIRAKWARGLFEKDEAMVAEAREAINAWNEKNPDQRMSPNMPAIWRRVREMAKDKDQRIADTAPKAMRQQFREETARVRESL